MVSKTNQGHKIRSVTFSGQYIAIAHAVCAYSAFFAALIVGCWLHYYKIVKNSSFGYPDEWFPSVSATIGDRYPERSIFQILIALTAGPRFLLLTFNFLILYKENSWLPYLALISGVIRTFTCGGWVYITSTDDHDWHDIFMISYIVLTIPWTVFISKLSPKGSIVRRGRIITASTFFFMLIPLIYWFIQHKVHVRAGAYSVYAYFEWALIILDIGFDCWSMVDFKLLEITVSGSGLNFNPVEKMAAVKETIEPEVKSAEVFASTDTEDFLLVEYIVNAINSFMVWTVLTSLFLCVWYFPLWHMGLSGYEAAIVSLFLAPLVLLIPGLNSGVKNYPMIPRLATIIFGLGAYKCHNPEQKLISVSLGSFFAILSFVNELSSLYNHPKRFTSYCITFMIGCLGSSVVKFMYYSNNPFWAVMHKPNGGANEIGITIGILSALLTPKTTGSEKEGGLSYKGGSLLLAALGIGGYFYSIFSYLSDTSTLVFWTWSGYPIQGPTYLTGGLINVAAVSLGLLYSLKLSPERLSGTVHLMLGALGAGMLYTFPDWIGYAGASLYSFYLASMVGIIFSNAKGHNAGALFSLAFFFSIIISLASVWVVAYAFVPGGFLLRERSDIVLFTSFIMVLSGVLNYRLKAPVERMGKRVFSYTVMIATILLAATGSITYNRTPKTSPTPYNAQSKTFTAGIWCIHFGLDNDMWSSHDRMKNLIEDAQLDIVGLLETDTQRLIGGNRDFTQKIAEDLGMYVDYGPGPNKHTWGAALLSKFPIIESTHHLLPSPVGELAPAIHATLDIYGQLVDVVVFHSGQEEDVEDRRLQSLALADIMGNSSRPLVLLSYLVTKPLQGNYNTYVSDSSRMHDIDSTDWDRWCEYILFRDLKKVAYARISRSTITDTELQIAKFRPLSGEEAQVQDDDFLYGNHFVDEKDIPEALRMPKMFRGRGVRGHKYHVFKKPRYFALEKVEK